MHKCVLLSLVLFALRTPSAAGCSCFPTQLNTTYLNSYYTQVVTARVLFITSTGDYNHFSFKVTKVYKGCAITSFVAKSHNSSATCGISLQQGIEYIIPLSGEPGIPILSLCQYIRPVKSLTAEELNFLSTRNVCCGSSCTCASGEDPVNCFVAPCSVASCPSGTTCVENYCGGCSADCYS